MKPILEINNLSKRFRLHHESNSYLSLRDSLSNPAQLLKRKSDEDFWALKDVSFNVMPGESIGIIGKNGAGKSTLLKILSKITPPTSGSIISRGRVASLLEVGTGFHAELSGRENIFLNGSILGMRKKEISARFDAIVDFAGVEKFLDTPLKHYSSGMQLRLAFAVAAFLEPEILIIDEVLAVGDAEFQKKCMGKMGEVTKEGRTILFVSHNLQAVEDLCSKAILLEKGQIKMSDSTVAVIDTYLQYETKNNFFNDVVSDNAKIVSAEIISATGKSANFHENGNTLRIKIDVRNPKKENLKLALAFFDPFDRKLWNFTNDMYNLDSLPNKENMQILITFETPHLTAHEVYMHIALSNQTYTVTHHHLAPALKFQVIDSASEKIIYQKPHDCMLYCEAKMDVN